MGVGVGGALAVRKSVREANRDVRGGAGKPAVALAKAGAKVPGKGSFRGKRSLDRGGGARILRLRYGLCSYTKFAFTVRFPWWGSGEVEARLRVVA